MSSSYYQIESSSQEVSEAKSLRPFFPRGRRIKPTLFPRRNMFLSNIYNTMLIALCLLGPDNNRPTAVLHRCHHTIWQHIFSCSTLYKNFHFCSNYFQLRFVTPNNSFKIFCPMSIGKGSLHSFLLVLWL